MTKIIISEKEYRDAVLRFLEICDSEPGTAEHKEAIELTKLMEAYENRSNYNCNSYN